MPVAADIEQEREIALGPGTPTRMYLAGPMTGMTDFNVPVFNAAAASLRDMGYEVINPTECDAWFGEPGNVPHRAYMRQALINIGMCDAIALLPMWTYSMGAKLELHAALAMGMDTYQVYGGGLDGYYLSHAEFTFESLGQAMQVMDNYRPDGQQECS